MVAVGMSITAHPPRRSGRALLTHPAPTLGVWRKSAALDLLLLGVDLTVIALWLGHEKLETTHQYMKGDVLLNFTINNSYNYATRGYITSIQAIFIYTT